MLWNLLLRLVSFLGLKRLRGLGARLGNLILRFDGAPARITDINIRLIHPDLDDEAVIAAKRKSVRHLGRYLMESVFAWGAVDRVSSFCEGIDGLEAVRKSLNSGKGALMLIPHFGCTELATVAVSDQLPPSIGLYRLLRPPSLYTAIQPQRFGRNCRALEAGLSAIRQARVHLGNGGVCLMALDIVPKALHEVEADMMGIRVKTSLIPSRLAQRTGAAVFVYCGLRTENGFRVIVRPTGPDMVSTDKEVAATEFNRQMAGLINLDPLQGHWFLKRFSSNPEIRQRYKDARLG